METKFIRQKDNPGALLNSDIEGLQAYKRQREIIRASSKHEERFQKIESTIDEVKTLLLQLMDRKDK